MTLILPINVQIDQHVNRQLHSGKAFTQRLKQVFGRELSCVWGNEDASDPAIKPGRWHIQYENPSGPNSYFPITTPDGGYRDPAEDVIEFLRERDMHRPGRIKELSDMERRREAAETAHFAKLKEARVDEIAGRIKAYDSPSVSFDTSKPWSYRVNGGADRRRREA
jgi:hypothetical protein